MFAQLFRRRRPLPRVPEGRRIYAVGDIHGRRDLLDELLDRIAQDEAARGGAGEIVFLGDLIDRGPDSAGVVDRLMALADTRPGTRFLAGNHEEVFLEALSGDARALRFFCRIGGMETILSYGIAPNAYRDAGFDTLAAMVDRAVPTAHRRFLAGFEDMIAIGDYVFVHAGIRSGVALDAQAPKDLRWIREGFLDVALRPGPVVVHGHTIVDGVEERPGRIALDTGAWRTGRLTAMGFEGADRWIVQTGG